MKINMRFLITILAVLLVIFLYFGYLLHAQPKPYNSYKECMNNFNINLASSDELFFEKVKVNVDQLRNFYTCRAAANNEPGECYNLKDSKSANSCVYDYKQTVGFNSILVYNNRITPELMKNCYVSGGDSMCKRLAEAYIKQDPSIACDKNNFDCIAGITSDVNLARSQQTKDMIFFIKAIKDFEIKNCLQIKDKNLQRQCRAYVKRDTKICEEDEEFKKFRNLYCQYCSQ